MALGYTQTLITQSADGAANTSGAAASMLNVSGLYTFPANYFQVGKTYEIEASGRISCVVTTPGTARYDVRLGGTVVFDTTAMNLNIVAKTNVGWYLKLLMTCRAIGNGTNANFFTQGFWTSEAGIASPLPTVGGLATFTLPYNAVPAAGAGFNSAQANALDMFFTQTAATGSHTCHNFALNELN